MKKALLLIDIQNGLDQLDYYGGYRNNPQAESNAGKILECFRKNRWPVFHVKHNSIHLDSPIHPSKEGNEIKSLVQPIDGEPVLEKNVNSAFIGTNLQVLLDEKQINHLIVVGLTTEHCVSTSVRTAANLGYKVTLVVDATAAFSKVGIDGEVYSAEIIHQTSLATLKDEFAELVYTEWMIKTCLSI